MLRKKCIFQSVIDEIFSVQMGIPRSFHSCLNASWRYSIKQGVHPPQHSADGPIHMSELLREYRHILNTLWISDETERRRGRKPKPPEIKTKTKINSSSLCPKMVSNYFRRWSVDWRGRGSQRRGTPGCSSGDADEGPPSLQESWRTRSPWAACFHSCPAHRDTSTPVSKDNTKQ